MMMRHLLLKIIFILFLSSGTTAQSLYFPPLTGNVWDSILPSSLNYCQPRIDSLYNYLQAKNTKSFILLKDGKRVLEKYFGTYTRDSVWYWASASKSLASFITGVAQEKGFININHPASQYLGNGWTNAPLAKENLITVKHLINMTSGLEDAPPAPCDNEDTAKACLTYLADAGTRWSYHTGAYRKVQDVVSNAVGQNYNAITTGWIKTKIGMGGLWVQQVYYGKARDMARFGLLNLNKGIWYTDTIMKDTAYFRAMTNTSQNLNNAYGYLWWLNGKSSFMAPSVQFTFPGTLMSNAPNDMYCALGKNDQKIYIVPSQGLVIVRQGNTAGGFNLAASAFDNVLWDYINKLNCAATPVIEKEANQHTIWPNPATSTILIDNNQDAVQSISLYDIYGNKLLYAARSHRDSQPVITVYLSDYPKGIYFIEIEHRDKQVSRRKIIKE